MSECIVCGTYVPEGEDLCPACLKETAEPCRACQLWTSEDQFDQLMEVNDYNRGSV